MKKEDIVKRLEKDGFEIVGTKYDYWNVAGVMLKDGKVLALAHGYLDKKGYGVVESFTYDDVQEAIAEANNNHLYRRDCHVHSMTDYYYFKNHQRVKV